MFESNCSYHSRNYIVRFEVRLYRDLQDCRELSINKSGGPDFVLNEFFKYGINEMIFYLCKLFNTIFEKGYFLTKWTEGLSVPLYKKGYINRVSNYRGITLLSALGKLFSRILNNRLTDWAEEYHIYVEAQAGFRKNMGTIDNIFVLHGVINRMLNENKKLYVAFIDYIKAFDYVVRENIWYKLLNYGVKGKIIDVIRSMYENIKSKVKYDNRLSNDFTCLLGTRQGECLSPFLFSMCVNELEEKLAGDGFKGVEVGMLKLLWL